MALSVNAAEVTLWEGEYTISGWTNGAEIAVDKVKAGDILTYTFTEAGADGAQVLIKGSDWNNMLGTAKINRTDMATGAVTVGVTQEMIDNCGGQFSCRAMEIASAPRSRRQESSTLRAWLLTAHASPVFPYLP